MNNLWKCLFFVFLFLVILIPVFSQNDDFSHSFQIRPLVYLSDITVSLLDDDSEAYSLEFSFEYQYAFNNYINLSLAPFFSIMNQKHTETFYSWGGWNTGTVVQNFDYYSKVISYGLTPGIIIRPFGKRLRGFYVKPYSQMGLTHTIISDYDINDTRFAISIMGELGYQWVFKKGFTITLGGSAGKLFFIPFENNKLQYIENKYPEINFNFSLGYSF